MYVRSGASIENDGSSPPDEKQYLFTYVLESGIFCIVSDPTINNGRGGVTKPFFIC